MRPFDRAQLRAAIESQLAAGATDEHIHAVVREILHTIYVPSPRFDRICQAALTKLLATLRKQQR